MSTIADTIATRVDTTGYDVVVTHDAVGGGTIAIQHAGKTIWSVSALDVASCIALAVNAIRALKAA